MKSAFRVLTRRPGFSLAVVAIFALGIAANVAIFSVFNGLFLSALPYPEPNRLLYLNESAPQWNLPKDVGIAYPDFVAWRAQNRSFKSMAVFTSSSANLSGFGPAVRVDGAQVSYDLGATLGIKPILGRDFLPEEDRKGGRKVALLSYGLWQRKFAGSPDVTGKILRLDNQPYTIVGVLPKTAVFPDKADVWTPLALDPSDQNTGWFLEGVGRLKPGVRPEQALADLTRIHKALIPTRDVNKITSPTAIPLRDEYLGDYRLVTRALLGAVGFVLLIACVNVAGLMMARGTSRAREVAIRAALGAGKAQLVRQLLTESLLLAAAGGAAGVGLGWLALQAMLGLMPDALPGWVDFHIDIRFAAFALVLTGAAAVLSGLGPALESSKVDVRGFLADAAPKSSLSGARRRAMNTLVVGEIALALVLLASAGLVWKAFGKVLSVDPGFRPANVLTFTLDLPDAKYPKPEQQVHFYENLLPQLRATPGVEAASLSSLVPLGSHNGTFFEAEGEPPLAKGETDPVVLQMFIFPGYFRAMGVDLKAGRDFDDHDGDSPGTTSAIVSEGFAKLHWHDADPVGKRVSYRSNHPMWMRVVGVAADTKHYGLDRYPRPEVYMPYRQQARNSMNIVLRSNVEATSLIAAAREVVRRADPDLALYDVQTMQARLERSLWVRRTYSWLFGVFAALALALAVAGIYGVVSYAVTQRTREIGIRMALGANPGQVLNGVLREGMLLAGIGVVIGIVGALIGTRLLESLLAGVSPHDPWAFVAVTIGLTLAALAANFIPARRAASVDPMRALRFE
jgi:putative ABC transport system permease protein